MQFGRSFEVCGGVQFGHFSLERTLVWVLGSSKFERIRVFVSQTLVVSVP